MEKSVPYMQDRIEGEVQEFWEEGQIKTKTPYRNGQKEGPASLFGRQAERRSKEEYCEWPAQNRPLLLRRRKSSFPK